MVNYTKRGGRIKDLVIDLGDGDTLKIRYKPARLTHSMLRELSESQEVVVNTATDEKAAEQAKTGASQWEVAVRIMLGMVVEWDLTATGADGKDYVIPLTVEGLKEVDFDMLDALTIINTIREAEQVRPLKGGQSTPG